MSSSSYKVYSNISMSSSISKACYIIHKLNEKVYGLYHCRIILRTFVQSTTHIHILFSSNYVISYYMKKQEATNDVWSLYFRRCLCQLYHAWKSASRKKRNIGDLSCIARVLESLSLERICISFVRISIDQISEIKIINPLRKSDCFVKTTVSVEIVDKYYIFLLRNVNFHIILFWNLLILYDWLGILSNESMKIQRIK